MEKKTVQREKGGAGENRTPPEKRTDHLRDIMRNRDLKGDYFRTFNRPSYQSLEELLLDFFEWQVSGFPQEVEPFLKFGQSDQSQKPYVAQFWYLVP